MFHPRILTTAASLASIERATRDYLKSPVRLLYDGNHEWRVCKPDMTPFGSVNVYSVIRVGTQYHLVAHEKIPPANVVHREQEEAAS